MPLSIRVCKKKKKKKRKKKIFRPTYPNFWGNVTGNTHTFLFGLILKVLQNNANINIIDHIFWRFGFKRNTLFALFYVWKTYARHIFGLSLQNNPHKKGKKFTFLLTILLQAKDLGIDDFY